MIETILKIKPSVLGVIIVALNSSAAMIETASADSLLAPLIVNTGAGAASAPFAAGPVSTYLNIKVKGQGSFSAFPVIPQDQLHYVWIKKGSSVGDLGDLNKSCKMIDNSGFVTANDMVFQDTGLPPALANRVPSGTIAPDLSIPNTYYAADFVGMVVVSDMANIGTKGNNDPEGNLSGFAYIVDAASGDIVDYKLLNNHYSAGEGDFSSGFVAKKSVDFAWMSSIAAQRGVSTTWTAMVTGPDMSQHTGLFTDSYDASVLFSQKTHPDGTQDSPLINGQSGVFGNDEVFTSANPKFSVTCMGSFDRAVLLGGDPQLLADTANGGWLRMSIQPTARINPLTGEQFPSNHAATGAIVYRDDVINAGGVHATLQGQHSMVIETSGHLVKGANHPNRPY